MTKIINFFKESYGELKKSVWLSRSQMIQSTIFVFIVVGIVTLYISIIDWGLAGILGSVIGGR
ncbi:MAG: preprotein translocase subunit SecE [Elusimicrobiaceae bacterium]|nr:preprotein translocase subunit SecE [Elusimicrobiaceae bacterium]